MNGAPTAFCREDRPRREDVRASGLNGLDYIEVSEKDRHLRELARGRLIEREGRFTWDDRPSRIGIAYWERP